MRVRSFIGNRNSNKVYNKNKKEKILIKYYNYTNSKINISNANRSISSVNIDNKLITI